MRRKMYDILVNRKVGIRQRYHRFHDGTTGMMKVLSWVYLLLLNVGYYVFFLRFFGTELKLQTYESKRIPLESESRLNAKNRKMLSVDEYVEKLSGYDIISFDVFDTLIFRAVSVPADVFYFVGERLSVPDFRNIRTWAEWDARLKCDKKNEHMEVTFREIWDNLAKDTGLNVQEGMNAEWEAELSLCYANPFMLKVWNKLRESGKTLIIMSDMYLSSVQIKELLERNGFTGASKIFVSCEYGKSKADGKLYEIVKKKITGRTHYHNKKMIHVGDNQQSDVRNARIAGISALHYPGINRNELLYRSRDMSYMVGSAYRALVNARIYNGLHEYSREYEFGYIYGGLFVLGYCSFIHDYYMKEGLDKLLFLSRDGDTLLKAYRKLFPEDEADYAYLSRKAAVKLMFETDRHDYFRRFLNHKINQEYTVGEILESMELDELIGELHDWRRIYLRYRLKEEREFKSFRRIRGDEEKLKKLRIKEFVDLKRNDELTDKNAYLLRRFIEAKWDKVRKVYEGQICASGKYYKRLLGDAKKAAAVDIGWAGSGAISLYRLSESRWNLPCDVRGIVAGTNTVYNSEPDASEHFLQSGRLVSYMYSQSHNRDLLKKHDPAKGYNVFFELLLSSDAPQFTGFYEGDARVGADDIYDRELDITLRFGKRDVDPKGAARIRKGILDFVDDYRLHFSEHPEMMRISGRDAYAPMLVAASHNEKYLKSMEKRLGLEINVV